MEGKPVCEMLGGRARRIPVYGSSMRRDIKPEEEAARLARLQEIEGPGDLFKAACAVLAACAAGELSPAEANEVVNLITAVRAIEKMGCVETRVMELERRAQACEEAAPFGRRASRPAPAASGPLEPAPTAEPPVPAPEPEDWESRFKYLFADFENFRRRAGKERDSLRRTVRGDVILGLLPSFEAAQRACRSSSPDHAYYRQVADRIDHNRASLSVARKLCRRAYHVLRELGDDAFAPLELDQQHEEAIAAAA
jgi:hypothetical protein